MNNAAAIHAGLFVSFVYARWNSVSATTSLDNMRVQDLSGANLGTYQVLKTIYANDLITDFDLDNPGSKGWVTIGVVAANSLTPAEITDVVLAIRGTEGIWEWVQDAKFLPKPFPNTPGGGLTEDGFTDMYQSFSFEAGTCDKNFATDLLKMIPSGARVTVCGHSLGAALATLLAFDMGVRSTLPIVLYTLASPRVGDLTFSHLFNHVVPNAYRVANRLDIVPKVPPPLMYVHVGDETELVPGKDMKFDLGCEHDLMSYFHMLAALDGDAVEYPLKPTCTVGNPLPPAPPPAQ
jgi:hypothetical protein